MRNITKSIFASLLLVTAAFGDKIILKSGTILDGKIVETSPLLRIDVDGLVYEVDKEQVERVVITESSNKPVPIKKVMRPAEKPVSNPTNMSVPIGLASAGITGLLLSINNTKTVSDDEAARSAQAMANLSAAFGGESRTVDPRLYESKEERFSSTAIIMLSAAVGVVVISVMNHSQANAGHSSISPYLMMGDTVGGGVSLRIGQ